MGTSGSAVTIGGVITAMSGRGGTTPVSNTGTNTRPVGGIAMTTITTGTTASGTPTADASGAEVKKLAHQTDAGHRHQTDVERRARGRRQ